METEQTSSQMEICILVNTRMANPQDLANTNGRMATRTQANSSKARSMARVNGKRNQQIRLRRIDSISMMATTSWIRNMVMANFSGSQATDTRATTIKMRDKDMVQWNGQMAASTKDIGSKVHNMVSA